MRTRIAGATGCAKWLSLSIKTIPYMWRTFWLDCMVSSSKHVEGSSYSLNPESTRLGSGQLLYGQLGPNKRNQSSCVRARFLFWFIIFYCYRHIMKNFGNEKINALYDDIGGYLIFLSSCVFEHVNLWVYINCT